MPQASTDTATIAAISTPPGAGGIGIIRMSGPDSCTILREVFQPHSDIVEFTSHRFYYGRIIRPGTDKVLDEVLAVYMRSPRTYTREDVVEIHCHGSRIVLQNILELILTRGGVLAGPGEFTKRAFLNGRIDLTRAEAVIDILAAKTRKGVDIAEEQLAGTLFKRIDVIRKEVIQISALIEVAIDFPEDDVEIVDAKGLLRQLDDRVTSPLRRLITNAENGKIYRDGITVVIAGRPNVGKSSLLNTLLQEDRALVTALPGTTRDTIEEYLDIDGVPVRIVDTAGIRAHADEVEALGIQRAKTQINQADLVLFMVDGSERLTEADHDLFAAIGHKPLLVVINKMDLTCDCGADLVGLIRDSEVCRISAKEQTGIIELRHAIFRMVTTGQGQWQEDACAPNVRHKGALVRALAACERIMNDLQCGLTNDLLAVDLQECLAQLAEIVGETTTDDILDAIFTTFCIGK